MGVKTRTSLRRAASVRSIHQPGRATAGMTGISYQAFPEIAGEPLGLAPGLFDGIGVNEVGEAQRRSVEADLEVAVVVGAAWLAERFCLHRIHAPRCDHHVVYVEALARHIVGDDTARSNQAVEQLSGDLLGDLAFFLARR